MVHCPHCGAANPDESLSCGECGQALPARDTGTLCPMCSHGNPAERATCERCGARLIPLVAPSVSPETPDLTPRDSIPDQVPLATEDEPGGEAPDWLRRMRDRAAPGGPEPEPESLAESVGPSDQVDRVEPSASEVQPPESPDWLSRLESPSTTPSVEPESEPMEVPDWLHRLEPRSPDLPAAGTEPEDLAATEAEPPPAAADVPDWLAELAPEETEPAAAAPAEVPPAAAELPDWLADMAPAEAELVEEPLADAEVPDWLSELASTEAEPSAAEPAEVPDWLAELAPEETEPAAAEPVEVSPAEAPLAEAEVPDWLSELASTEAEPSAAESAEAPPAEAPLAEAEVPDWLAEPAEAPLAEAEVPDWLAELAPAEAEPAEVPPAEAPLAEAEVPDWLAKLAPAEAEVAAAEPSEVPPTEAEVPDWLADLAPAEAEPAEAPLAEAEAEPSEVPPAEAELPDVSPVEAEFAEEPLVQAEVPDWLSDLAPTEAEEAAAEPAEVPPTEAEAPLVEAEVPDWLSELAPAEAEPAEVPPAEAELPDWLVDMPLVEADPAEQPLAEAEVPDWLSEQAPVEVKPVEAEAELSDRLAEMAPPELEPDAAEPAEIQLPDWLADLGPAVPPVAESQVPDWLMAPTLAEPSEAGPALEDEALAQAEIPSWLQAMRAGVAPAPVSEDQEEEVETSGLLAGIAGVVRPASVLAEHTSAPIRSEQIGAEATLARARLWQELIARSAQPAVSELPQVRVPEARGRVERWLIYGIVLLAVFIPIFADIDLSNLFGLNASLTTETIVAHDLIDEVAAGAPVLMAFDYDASHMGELHLQAEALLRHLAQKQARIVAVSLTPEGAALAQQLLHDVLNEGDDPAEIEFVNLGYLPGEALGIRSLEFLPVQFQDQGFDGRTLGDAHIFDQDEGFALSNMSLLVVLTGNANNVRWWVEQTTALENDLSLVAGVSAAIEPLVRPYYDMEPQQIDGLVVGLMGAYDYERELNLDGPAHFRLGGQLVGQVAVLILIVLGVLIYGVSRRGEGDAQQRA